MFWLLLLSFIVILLPWILYLSILFPVLPSFIHHFTTLRMQLMSSYYARKVWRSRCHCHWLSFGGYSIWLLISLLCVMYFEYEPAWIWKLSFQCAIIDDDDFCLPNTNFSFMVFNIRFMIWALFSSHLPFISLSHSITRFSSRIPIYYYVRIIFKVLSSSYYYCIYYFIIEWNNTFACSMRHDIN